MKITEKLILLAEILSQRGTLYLVGGIVRNTLLGINDGRDDIDVCADLSTMEVERLLAGTCFKIVASYKRFGTLLIETIDGKEKYEFTSFREDSYRIGSGLHSPVSVNFTKNINIDAERRDFKCNAVYYDILKGVPVDPLGGMKTIKEKVISATRNPNIIFGEDPLRILRMVRQAVELNFNIDPKTYDGAKENVDLIAGISKERIRDEFRRIICADQKYPGYSAKDSHIKGLKMLFEIGAMKYILPSILELSKIKEGNTDQTLLDMAINAYSYAESKVRIAALLHNVGKPYQLSKMNTIYGHEINSANEVVNLLGEKGLMFPKEEVFYNSKLVRECFYNYNGEVKDNKLIDFIRTNQTIFDDLMSLKEALYKTYSKNDEWRKIIDHFKAIKQKMIADKIPFRYQDFYINGNDCLAYGFKEAEIKEVLAELYKLSAYNPRLRTKEGQIKFLENKQKKRQEIGDETNDDIRS